MKLTATIARGLESVLADELSDLGAGAIDPGAGVVAFEGDLALAYRPVSTSAARAES